MGSISKKTIAMFLAIILLCNPFLSRVSANVTTVFTKTEGIITGGLQNLAPDNEKHVALANTEEPEKSEDNKEFHPVSGGKSPLSIILRTDQDAYLIGETVEYDLIIINTGDVDVESIQAHVYSDLANINKSVQILSPGQESRFSGKFHIDSDFSELSLKFEIAAEGWCQGKRVTETNWHDMEINSNSFIELITPTEAFDTTVDSIYLRREKIIDFDCGPPLSVLLPEFIKTSATRDTIAVEKIASPSDICKTYDVKLQVTGEPAPAPVDVVLVMDRSGSMSARAGRWPLTVMDHAKHAAKKFTDDVLSNSNNRIAVVSFTGPSSYGDVGRASDARREIGFSNSAAAVKNAISRIDTYYGTNIEAGFILARNIIETSGRQNANKVIVFLTDGVATCSIGNPAGPNEPFKHNVHTRAAYRAGQACWDVAMVFTVGLFNRVPRRSKNTARQTLQWTQNAGYYEAQGAPDLSKIYDKISGQLGYSAVDAVITDVISDKFELVSDSLTSNPNAPVSYDATTRTITWHPGTITNLAELNYQVKSKEGVKGNDLPTSHSAVLRYTDINGNPNKEQHFPVSAVNVIGVEAGPDSIIVIGDVINIGKNLKVYGYAPFQYMWTNDTDPNWSSSECDPVIIPQEDTVYTIQITDSNGCKATDSIFVTVKKGKIIIKKVVSAGSARKVDTAKEFVVHVDGPNGKAWNTFIKHDQIREIGNLCPGQYHIHEIVPMDYKLIDINNSNINLTREMIERDEVVTVTVRNRKAGDSWFRHEAEENNFFTVSTSCEKRDATEEEGEGSTLAMENIEAILLPRTRRN